MTTRAAPTPSSAITRTAISAPTACARKDVHLVGGLVMENTVACPKHGSVFDFVPGEVDAPPACENLRTYKTQVAPARIEVEV